MLHRGSATMPSWFGTAQGGQRARQAGASATGGSSIDD